MVVVVVVVVNTNRGTWKNAKRNRLSISDGKLSNCIATCGSVADWLACWTQAQKGLGSNRSWDAVG